MRKLLIPLRKGLALFLASFFLLATLGAKGEPIRPLDADAQRLSLALIADVHTESNNFDRFKVNLQSLKHLSIVKDSADALVVLGDNTMNGQIIENLLFYGFMETVNPLKPYYTVTGNHDVGNFDEPNGTFEKYRARQLDYFQTFVDRKIDELYYSETVNGYTLLFLGPDTEECDYRMFSDKQLDWLEAQLDAAAADGSPVFIFTHHPLMYIDRGAQRYEQIVTKYPNVFVIVGHMHYYIHFGTLHGAYDTPEIWVPCFSMMNDDGSSNDKTGLGYLMEVYDDEVVFRGVNYYEAELTDVEESYALTAVEAEG